MVSGGKAGRRGALLVVLLWMASLRQTREACEDLPQLLHGPSSCRRGDKGRLIPC